MNFLSAWCIAFGLMLAGGDGNGWPWVNFLGLAVATVGFAMLPKDPYGKANRKYLR